MANYLFRDPDVVFIHIPKNSGTSLRHALGPKHEMQVFGAIPADWPNVPRLSVIRAPRARFLSAVRMFKFGVAEPDDYYHTARLPDLTVTQALDLIEDASVPFDRTIREPLANLKHHIWPQTHPFNGLHLATHVLRFETLQQDFSRVTAAINLDLTLPHTRKGSVPSGTIKMTGPEEARFAQLFAQDLDLLGYGMDDRPTGDLQPLPTPAPMIYDLWTPLFSSRGVGKDRGHRALPRRDADLTVFGETTLPGAKGRTWPGRKRNLVEHLRELRPEFGGASYRAFLVAACIVVLRRADPGPVQDHALHLLFRALDGAPIWQQLNLRWLTSVADTLADHGRTGEERAFGMAGALLANTIKLAESERRMLLPPAPWPPRVLHSGGGLLFDGVIAFGIERGDMIRNMLSRVDTLAGQDQLGGGLLREIVKRVEHEDTVFRRMTSLNGQPKPPLSGRFRRKLLSWVLRRLG